MDLASFRFIFFFSLSLSLFFSSVSILPLRAYHVDSQILTKKGRGVLDLEKTEVEECINARREKEKKKTKAIRRNIGRRGEERRVYEFRVDGWIRLGNVKLQEPPSSPSLCTVLHGRIMVEPCLDRALWDVIAVRARGECRNPDRSVTVLTFDHDHENEFLPEFSRHPNVYFHLFPRPSSLESSFRSIFIPNAFD